MVISLANRSLANSSDDASECAGPRAVRLSGFQTRLIVFGSHHDDGNRADWAISKSACCFVRALAAKDP
jgi:hypothetical protein